MMSMRLQSFFNPTLIKILFLSSCLPLFCLAQTHNRYPVEKQKQENVSELISSEDQKKLTKEQRLELRRQSIKDDKIGIVGKITPKRKAQYLKASKPNSSLSSVALSPKEKVFKGLNTKLQYLKLEQNPSQTTLGEIQIIEQRIMILCRELELLECD